jgi:hypothetical protein
VITQKGKLVFVAESFELPVARKLASMILGAQGNGPLQNASTQVGPLVGTDSQPGGLSAPLIRFMSNCGVSKAAVDAVVEGTRHATYHPFR